MPYVTMTLQETVESVSRPILFDMIAQIKSITKVDSTAKIIFPGDTGKMQQQGSSIDNKDRQTELSTGRYVYVEVEEDYDPQYMATTAITFPEQNPIFYDPDTHVTINPLYATTRVTLHFKYQAPSRTEVLRWRDDIRMRLSGMRDIHLHQISYHFLMPDQYMLLLRAVYNNKQRILNSNQTFQEYVASNITSRAKLISDMVGQDVRLSIAETQTRIVGMYGFDSMPEKPTRDSDTAVWTGEFTYEFTYEKPNMMAARYPVIVYNELLPKEFIGFWNKEYDLDNVRKSYSYSIGSLSNFESEKQPGKYINFKAETRLPDFDDFNPQTVPTSSVGIVTALCQVDETDYVSLMNLNDLGSVVIDSDILNFIQQSELPFITNLYQSIFSLDFYTNYTLMSTGQLVCLPDLTVQSVNKLSLTNFYHVRFSIITDLSLINYAFFQRLQNFPKALYKIIVAINESLNNNPYLQSISELPQVSAADFNLIFSKMLGLRNVGVTNPNAYTRLPASITEQTGQSVIYSGNSGSGLINDPFATIRGQSLENYRNLSIRMNTVYLGSIAAYRTNT